MRQRGISLTARSPPQIRERAPSGALSPEHASDKGDEAPLSLIETRSPSNDKGVPSQPEHSLSETTIVFPETDNSSSTLPSLEKGAEDKNEDEEGSKIPPHSSKGTLRIMMKDIGGNSMTQPLRQR